ncbi:hypothetical protein [Dyella nitratireducens]|uniref:Metallo-beta-lactamase domain-containing protein n=1 Tax=Dyella nitratireducens TaxID=1849580 RepID=A0ABQ1GAY2_9GAMM|nr:hypothetical protein [Dyella nitratireducens]GGA40172.1 hypothetical protein GCM10010981_31790 [Dyella nitratireducens]GLQ40537.1 hypothetical protein GCM10007902_03860 [Dyella nitratireducens]
MEEKTALSSTDVASTITATADTATLQLIPATVTEIKGVRVFDVGQGDCIGLRDQNDEVCCYVDYGGNEYHPDQSNPSRTASRLPVQAGSHYVPVILTHWDKDHYWSANKKNPAAQKCEWLVPRQLVSPQATRFAAKLANAKCWPESIGDQAVSFAVGTDDEVEIRKCATFPANAQKEDRNHSGLAINLKRQPSGGTATHMLLPGDCAFDRIPNLPAKLSLRAIVAYHHGASTDWCAATEQTLANAYSPYVMAYSYGTHSPGKKNHYGHPNRSNYQSCHPNWDIGAIITEDIRAKGLNSSDLDW